MFLDFPHVGPEGGVSLNLWKVWKVWEGDILLAPFEVGNPKMFLISGSFQHLMAATRDEPLAL